jgi:hypothetical protein
MVWVATNLVVNAHGDDGAGMTGTGKKWGQA